MTSVSMSSSAPRLLSSVVICKEDADASCQAHSSVERAGLLGDVTMRLLEPDEDLSLRGKKLAEVCIFFL